MLKVIKKFGVFTMKDLMLKTTWSHKECWKTIFVHFFSLSFSSFGFHFSHNLVVIHLLLLSFCSKNWILFSQILFAISNNWHEKLLQTTADFKPNLVTGTQHRYRNSVSGAGVNVVNGSLLARASWRVDERINAWTTEWMSDK